jgi:hypothetical protein
MSTSLLLYSFPIQKQYHKMLISPTLVKHLGTFRYSRTEAASKTRFITEDSFTKQTSITTISKDN